MPRSKTAMGGSEFAPLAERSRYMQAFRVLVSAVVILFIALTPESVGVGRVGLVVSTLTYLLLSLAGSLVWRLSRERGLMLFGALLITDGVFLAWVAYATGGTLSPLRYLIVLHLIAVALLASYRTGLKLALWHSILIFAVHYAEEANVVLPSADFEQVGGDFQQLVSFVVVFWLVAIGTATFSAVNERELRRHRADLEILAQMAASLEEVHEAGEVAERGLQHIAEAFDLPRVLLVAGPPDGLRLLASYGNNVNLEAVTRSSPGRDDILVAAQNAREATLIETLDPELDPWLTQVLPEARNLVFVPLSAEGVSQGVLVAEYSASRGVRVERRLVSILERFASHIALSLHNSALVERLQSIADTDGLTGIANRRRFDAALATELSRARRTDRPLSLVILDLDHFKDLNDTYGHQAGDDVLREVGAALRRGTRDFDIPSRYGGEEFAIILPDCAPAQATRVAERLRSAIGEVPAPTEVTASAGVASYPVGVTSARDLIDAADAALYAAKEAGRDRLMTSGPHDISPASEAVVEKTGVA